MYNNATKSDGSAQINFAAYIEKRLQFFCNKNLA